MKRLLAYLFLVLSLGLMFNVYAEAKPKSWIGIEFRAVTEEFIKKNKLNTDTPKNIIVTGVVKTSAADEAKILPGDVIISMDNNVIKKTPEEDTTPSSGEKNKTKSKFIQIKPTQADIGERIKF